MSLFTSLLESAMVVVGTTVTACEAMKYVSDGTATKHVHYVRDEITLRTAQLKARFEVRS